MTATTLMIKKRSFEEAQTASKSNLITNYVENSRSLKFSNREYNENVTFPERINPIPLTEEGNERIIIELISDELKNLALKRCEKSQTLKQFHANCLAAKFPVIDEDKLPLKYVKLINRKNVTTNSIILDNNLKQMVFNSFSNNALNQGSNVDLYTKNKSNFKINKILKLNSEAATSQKFKKISNDKNIEWEQNINFNNLVNNNKIITEHYKHIQNKDGIITHNVEEDSINRRFSAMPNDNEDFANCDCTALATASWARFQKRRKIKLVTSKALTSSSISTTSSSILPLAAAADYTISDDSGLASSISTTTIFSIHSLSHSSSSTNYTSSKLPPKQPNNRNRRTQSRSRALGILLSNIVSRMFDISAKKSVWQSKNNNKKDENLKIIPQLLIENTVNFFTL